MDWQAVGLSIRLSLSTSLVLAVLGLPLAYWIATTRFRGRFLIEAFVALPIVLPPTVLGFYILMAIGPSSPLGAAYASLFGRDLPFTYQGLLVASVLYSLPFAVQPFASGFASVDRRLLEASWSLGAGGLSTFLRVALPLAWPGVMTGIILSFAHTLGEFGVVLMIGGNIAGETRTVSVSIYDHVQAMDYASAHQTSLVLLVLSAITLAATYGLQRRWVQAWPTR